MWVNKLPIIIVLFILTAIVSYLSVSFIHLSLDPMAWTFEARAIAVIFVGFLWVMILGKVNGW